MAASLPRSYSNKCKPGGAGLVLSVRFKESRINLQCVFFPWVQSLTPLLLIWDLEVRKIMLYSEQDCKITITYQIKPFDIKRNRIRYFFVWSVLLYTTTSIISFKLSKAVNNSPIPRITAAEKILQISLCLLDNCLICRKVLLINDSYRQIKF